MISARSGSVSDSDSATWFQGSRSDQVLQGTDRVSYLVGAQGDYLADAEWRTVDVGFDEITGGKRQFKAPGKTVIYRSQRDYVAGSSAFVGNLDGEQDHSVRLYQSVLGIR